MFVVIEIYQIVASSQAQKVDEGWYFEVRGQEPQGPFRSRERAAAAAEARKAA